MNTEKFVKISESLRQYRRSDLRDYEQDIGPKPVDQLYVDPLPDNAVLRSVLSNNTTILLGRKGTGKSTVFAKAQSSFRQDKKIISIYIDVKSIYEVLESQQTAELDEPSAGIAPAVYRAHMLRKIMLGQLISQLLQEVQAASEKATLFERWKGAKRQYDELKNSLASLATKVKSARLEQHELPILQKINAQVRSNRKHEHSETSSAKATAKGSVSATSLAASGSAEGTLSDFDKVLDDNDVYNEYSDVVLKSFPFAEIVKEIQDLLVEADLKRLVVFFDDFSELRFVDQRLFVDVVLAPLNNASNEAVKLKIAGYPGRVYFGKIDPTKVDTIGLDFSELFEASEVQEMEQAATNYASRLLSARFSAFGAQMEDYFDTAAAPLESYARLLFQASFNVPRIMGHILHLTYLDRISRGQKISALSIRLAARKYYENTVSKYFDLMNRYALEPFENKLDRHNQKLLLAALVAEARSVRKKIIEGAIGGQYFKGLGNPPTSHFIVSPDLDPLLQSLEANFFLSRYKHTRDKEGKPVIVYAFLMGLCESERMSWGYPEGRDFRNYFVQRCFDFTRPIHQYLTDSQTIRCDACGHCHPMEAKASIELYKWRCPECMQGVCKVVNLSDDFKQEVEQLDRDIMLDPIELQILTVLHDEDRQLRAGEISTLIDTTYQLVGRRTSKLQEMGLVVKDRDEADGRMKSNLTDRAEELYFP